LEYCSWDAPMSKPLSSEKRDVWKGMFPSTYPASALRPCHLS
jgi:hypothetical protein